MGKKTESMYQPSAEMVAEYTQLVSDTFGVSERWAVHAGKLYSAFHDNHSFDLTPYYLAPLAGYRNSLRQRGVENVPDSGPPTSEEREFLTKRWGEVFRQNLRIPLRDDYGLAILGDARSYRTKTGEYRLPPESKRFRLAHYVAKTASKGKTDTSASKGKTDTSASSKGNGPAVPERMPQQAVVATLKSLNGRTEIIGALADIAKHCETEQHFLALCFAAAKQARAELGELAGSVDKKTADSARARLSSWGKAQPTPAAVKAVS